MKANDIRQMFLDYFEQRGHRVVPSSSLVPARDPTLLFINAGMNQFKDVFLGNEKREYNRAVSSQKCVRAGGKHNDLEVVGFTNRHHTFFEMLGNFSFGDYFKREAIEYAWELVTSPDWYGIDKDRLFVTIFEGDKTVPRDDEAHKHWLSVGVPEDRIFACGAKDNFWQMGETGPCGPCSEMHYDMGPEASEEGHTDCAFPCECGRYMEIWNLVFMQFDRDEKGKLTPLPKPSIDTGAGLERLAAVLQGKVSNYDTDLFQPLIQRAGELTGSGYGQDHASDASLRIIADHARATTFLISDGVLPSNEGRGYVLRKIMRRAIRHGRLLGTNEPFLYEMVTAVCRGMGTAYADVGTSAERVGKIVASEETRFAHTLAIGLKKLEELLAESQAAGSGNGHMAGERAFVLYDTFGLPRDFIEDACRDQGLAFDAAGFDQAMEAQRERARASWKGAAKKAASPAFRKLSPTVFEGYAGTESGDCEILAIVHKGKGVKELKAGEEGEVVLDHTPFYAESGGQVGDTGWLQDRNRNAVLADVRSCSAPVQGVYAHEVVARQTLAVGDRVDAVVNAQVRADTMRNHTATHLLHAALRETLGAHVKQAGSLVDPGHLRFDFTHFADVADEELQDIEDMVNREVLGNKEVEVHSDVSIDTAVNEMKAMALFGEKYGDHVRVIRIGEFSTELCGGTHVARTGEIGLVKLVSESSVAAGTRRIEALSGPASLRRFQQRQLQTDRLADVLQVGDSDLVEAAERLAQQARQAEKQLEQARTRLALENADDLLARARKVSGIPVIAAELPDVDRGAMRSLVDTLRQKMGSGVVVLGTVTEGKVALIVGVTKDLTGKLHAGKIIKEVAGVVGGSGGGRPDLAEAGGREPSKLPQAMAQVTETIEKML